MGKKTDQFSIGDIEKITGIKSHILRYWEENVSLIQPKKTLSGHRVYSKRDLDFIYRLDYLVNKKKYTLEGATQELLNGIKSAEQESVAFSKLRNELLSIYELIQEGKDKA